MMLDDDDELWMNDGEEEMLIAPEGEITSLPYPCAACGEANETEFDPSGGLEQQYTEDCHVCCRPNLLTISVDPETRMVTLANELEYDC